MKPAPKPVVPIGPLLDAIGQQGTRTPLEISRRFGVDRKGIHRSIQRGHLSLWTADKIATQAGFSLYEIYDDELDGWIDNRTRRRLRINQAFAALRQELAS
jgi:hypothetical protein